MPSSTKIRICGNCEWFEEFGEPGIGFRERDGKCFADPPKVSATDFSERPVTNAACRCSRWEPEFNDRSSRGDELRAHARNLAYAKAKDRV